MSDLLASDFSRLIKSQVFYAVLAFCMEYPICEVVVTYVNNKDSKNPVTQMDGYLNSCFLVFGIMIAVFVSLFVGSEYSDGTMRNKLIAGYSRPAIYMSDFAVCIIAGVIFQIAYVITIAVLFYAVFNNGSGEASPPVLNMSLSSVLEMQLIGFYIIAAYTAIFLLFSILLQSRSNAAVVSLALALVMFAVGINLSNKVSVKVADVNQPTEIMQAIEEAQRGGELEGIQRTLFLFLDDFLPSCQSTRLSNSYYSESTQMTISYVPPRASTYAMYDGGIVVVTTALGLLLFRKKDLK